MRFHPHRTDALQSPNQQTYPRMKHATQTRYLKVLKNSLVCVSIMVLGGCAAPPRKVFAPPTDYVPIGQVQIQSRFDTVELTRENYGVEANRCVPQLDSNSQSIKKQLEKYPNKDIVGLGHASSSKLFVVHQTTAFCLHKSSEKLPILAAEAFINTVNPKGVPPDVLDGWYKRIAMTIATKGMAKVAYAFDNGNAYVTSYWVEASSQTLSYSNSFRKAGTWEAEPVDARFTHPTLSSVAETKRGGAGEKASLLGHRTL